MGELEGIRGAWGYPEGGMGAVSGAIAKSAMAEGAEIFTEKEVVICFIYIFGHHLIFSNSFFQHEHFYSW